MLLEFSISNHKSFRSEVLFSALAGKDNSNLDNIVEVTGERVLKSSVIYGANGSGKSNFINALAFVQSMVLNSVNHLPGIGVLQSPHKLDWYDKESTYSMQFVADGVRYAYGFSIKNFIISEEYLYYFPNGKQAKIFERNEDCSFTTSRSFTKKFNTCKDILKENKLMLSCAASFSSVDEVMVAYRFFSDDLIIYDPSSHNSWMKYSLYKLKDNPQVKSKVLRLFDALGTGIKDIKLTLENVNFDPSKLPAFLSDESKNTLIKHQSEKITAKVIYESFETDLFNEESNGIKKLFELICPFIDVMTQGKVLVCDELETNLHESLLYELLQLFIKYRGDKPSQLIFTTHDTGLLSLDLFRRDQIWFTEIRQEDRSTDLFSLAEIKNVRKDDNFGKGYISGKYGGIPMLNVNFANVISDN